MFRHDAAEQRHAAAAAATTPLRFCPFRLTFSRLSRRPDAVMPLRRHHDHLMAHAFATLARFVTFSRVATTRSPPIWRRTRYVERHCATFI